MSTEQLVMEAITPSPERLGSAVLWKRLKWWHRMREGDLFLHLPAGEWIRCHFLIGFFVGSKVVVRPNTAICKNDN